MPLLTQCLSKVVLLLHTIVSSTEYHVYIVMEGATVNSMAVKLAVSDILQNPMRILFRLHSHNAISPDAGAKQG